eukprot:925816-Pleurochrysis_carterae.AAC.1
MDNIKFTGDASHPWNGSTFHPDTGAVLQGETGRRHLHTSASLDQGGSCSQVYCTIRRPVDSTRRISYQRTGQFTGSAGRLHGTCRLQLEHSLNMWRGRGIRNYVEALIAHKDRKMMRGHHRGWTWASFRRMTTCTLRLIMSTDGVTTDRCCASGCHVLLNFHEQSKNCIASFRIQLSLIALK